MTLSPEISLLLGTAATIGLIHTVTGPDHYLPFIVLSKARHWSTPKTMWITFWCGIGHVAGSVVLGLIGIALGVFVRKMEWIESIRGEVAAWMLIGFGLLYGIWGMKRAMQKKSHTHEHAHETGDEHLHTHTHFGGHQHVHSKKDEKSLTPWILFLIFVFGPCEPLIPLLMVPAAKNSMPGLLAVTLVFAITTILTMLVMVRITLLGVKFIHLKKAERFAHAIAGFTLVLSGLAIQFLGL
ncbi:sulfite exporter TauE/SafE family protein [candidate division KSB1 bacterium]|nr:sulfite exporter TauE/SafE family protein [candidate division KSB1 bacterium]